jgi:hypothetical protein
LATSLKLDGLPTFDHRRQEVKKLLKKNFGTSDFFFWVWVLQSDKRQYNPLNYRFILNSSGQPEKLHASNEATLRGNPP